MMGTDWSWQRKALGRRATFNALQHPRDPRTGEFIEVGARVQIIGAGRRGRGRYVEPLSHNRVVVERDDGSKVTVHSASLRKIEEGNEDLRGMSDTDLIHGLRTAPTVDQARPLRDELTRRAGKQAHRILDRVEADEPAVTEELTEAVGQLGGRLTGVDFRMKSHESLTRKIRDKALLANKPTKHVGVTDALRYTAVFSEEDYAAGVQRVIDDFTGRGYWISDFDNSWVPGNPYQGVHVLIGGRAGFRMELQFHTAASYEMKESTHKDYELMRDPAAPVKERQAAFERMAAQQATVPVPPDVKTVGSKRVYRSPKAKAEWEARRQAEKANAGKEAS